MYLQIHRYVFLYSTTNGILQIIYHYIIFCLAMMKWYNISIGCKLWKLSHLVMIQFNFKPWYCLFAILIHHKGLYANCMSYMPHTNMPQGLFGGLRNLFQGITRPRGNRWFWNRKEKWQKHYNGKYILKWTMVRQSLTFSPGLQVQGGVDHHHLEVTLSLWILFLQSCTGKIENEKSTSNV